MAHTVTLTTGTGRQLIRCAGPNEAANLALTLRCDGWDAFVDDDTFAWTVAIDAQGNAANFDSANLWAIRRVSA